MTDEPETVEINRSALSVIVNHANTAVKPRDPRAVRNAIREAYRVLDVDAPIDVDLGQHINADVDTVSLTLGKTNREVTTHAKFDARTRKGPWDKGLDLHIEFEDDHLEKTMAEGLDEL